MTPPRLSPDTLERLPAEVERPAYDRAAASVGVVHLGVGAFHRAHQAPLFDALLAGGDQRWAVQGVSLRSAGVAAQLNPQAGLYTHVTREGGGERARVIGALRGVLVAPQSPDAVVEALAAPGMRLVTLTVTEKGYMPRFASEGGSAAPETSAEFIAAGLQRRRERGLPPFMALSCDNLSGNGDALRAAVLAATSDPGLRDCISAEGAFPNSMVDRIVPAVTDAERAIFAERYGVRDEGLVITEPFSQWVVEDRFAGERPPLDSVGVQFVADVAPFEAAKLRMLNGAHSTLAYLGALSGHTFVHEAIAGPLGTLVQRLWHETATTLRPAPGLDVPAYRRALLERFANPALPHRLRQIAIDGSQKLPQRLLAPLTERAAEGRTSPALELAVAAWMRWQSGRDETGEPFPVDDPLSAKMAEVVARTPEPEARARALLDLLGSPLPVRPDAVARIGAALARLERLGARAALQEVLTP